MVTSRLLMVFLACVFVLSVSWTKDSFQIPVILFYICVVISVATLDKHILSTGCV